jgi:hypothetical protein
VTAQTRTTSPRLVVIVAAVVVVAVRLAGAAWGTEDGATWTELPFGDHAAVAGATAVGGSVVVVTHVGTAFAGDAGVTFWIGED